MRPMQVGGLTALAPVLLAQIEDRMSVRKHPADSAMEGVMGKVCESYEAPCCMHGCVIVMHDKHLEALHLPLD